MTTATVLAVASDSGHNFSKPVKDTITLLEGLGVEGDAHMGKTVQHLSRIAKDPTLPNLRQVHLLHAELLNDLGEQGFDVSPGQIGENITTQGVPLLDLPTGTHLAIGETAIVEITGLRNPCRQLNGLHPGLMNAVLSKDAEGNLIRLSGVMGIVVAGGVIKAGDEITVAYPPEPHAPLLPV